MRHHVSPYKQRGKIGMVFWGFFLGVVLGVSLAAFTVWLVQGAPNPIQSRDGPIDEDDLVKPITTLKPATTNRGPTPVATAVAPGNNSTQAPQASLTVVPPLNADLTKPINNDSQKALYLQAGSFGSRSDADNQKARLALGGIESEIRQIRLADQSVLHRVVIGPYESEQLRRHAQALLEEVGIDSVPMKVKE